MEHDTRPFSPVNITNTRVERGDERYSEDRGVFAPPIVYWRCNLTALSQRYNLYFMASRSYISVWRPQFPFQTISKKPVLLIAPDLANPDAKGYIDTDRPHAVNHMVVGELGNEEILLICTDSGNVTAYYTRAIEVATKRDPITCDADGSSYCYAVPSFFSHWVQESAWGLSIHTRARMIAVSANVPQNTPTRDLTAKITVFAFGLTAKDESTAKGELIESEMSSCDEEWTEWLPAETATSLPTRNRNYKITLCGSGGHSSNIPCIDFVNTDDDPQGTLLFSTDISGAMKAWRIWQNLCVRTWDFKEKSSLLDPWLRPHKGGWFVAALDPKAFRITKTMAQFCGHHKTMRYHGHLGESYDISNVARLRVPSASQQHPLAVESDDEEVSEVMEEVNSSWFSEADLNDFRASGDECENEIPSWFSRAYSASTWDSNVPIPRPELSAGVDCPNVEMEASDHNTGRSNNKTTEQHQSRPMRQTRPTDVHLIEELSNRSSSDESSSRIAQNSSNFSAHRIVNSAEDELDESFEASSSHDSHTSSGDEESPIAHASALGTFAEDTISLPVVMDPDSTSSVTVTSRHKLTDLAGLMLKDRWRKQDFQLEDLSAIPTIHCTASHLRLLYAPRSKTPHFFCAQILKQMWPSHLDRGQHIAFDRMNMLQRIPELGIVIIASQVGRCAVCSLTRNGETGALGLRVDWMLPTKKQERAGVRPLVPLLGVAVGPVQCRRKSSLDSETSPVPEWPQDRLVDGVQTTFDREVTLRNTKDDHVIAGEPFHNDKLPHPIPHMPDDNNFVQSKNSSTKRKRRASKSSSSNDDSISTSPRPITESRPWNSSPDRLQGDWAGAETSRRYRLMMTYTDMTILTYELSRAVEQEDLAPLDISALDIDDE